MANPISNFNWQMPTASDLVTDLPADFEVFGQAVDTSLADLKGGTTGQVLKKNSNTDMDFVWSADSAGMTNPMTTTGDTIYSSSGSTPARLGIGSTGQVLTVSGGLPAWSTPSGSTLSTTLITNGSLTSGTSLTLSSLTSYDQLFLSLTRLNSNANGSQLRIRVNGDSGGNYATMSIENRVGGTTVGDGFTSVGGGSFLVGNNYGFKNTTANGTLIALTNCKSSSGLTNVAINSTFEHFNTSDRVIFTGQNVYLQNATISSITIDWADGNTFSAGAYRLYGA
jgi:hypothetical protein